MNTIIVLGKTYKAVSDETTGGFGCERCAFKTNCESKESSGVLAAEAEAGIDCIVHNHHYEEVS